MTIPSVIQAYFAADRQDGAVALVPLFKADAVVSDERRSHEGIAAIRDWWATAKERYDHRTEPLDAQFTDGVHVVKARVTGRFPGSPLTLTYRFRLIDDTIATLEIG